MEIEKESEILISIVIPVHEDHKYWERAIKSANLQDFEQKQVLISVNNDKFPRIKLENFLIENKIEAQIIDSKKIAGVSFALNEAIKASEGKYIAWLSSDDFWETKYLSSQYENIRNSHKDAAMSIGGWKAVDEGNQIIGIVKPQDNINGIFLGTKWDYLNQNIITGCSVVIKKSIIEEMGFFKEDLLYTQDYDMWYKILEKYEVTTLNEVNTTIQVHENRTTIKDDICKIEKENCELWANIINIQRNVSDDKYLFQIFENVHETAYEKLINLVKSEILNYYKDYGFKEISIPYSTFNKLALMTNNDNLVIENLKLERNQLGTAAYNFRLELEEHKKILKNIRSRKVYKLMKKIKFI
jgi:teichuronic acid biosynthesis glycosyltransferase TuaG